MSPLLLGVVPQAEDRAGPCGRGAAPAPHTALGECYQANHGNPLEANQQPDSHSAPSLGRPAYSRQGRRAALDEARKPLPRPRNVRPAGTRKRWSHARRAPLAGTVAYRPCRVSAAIANTWPGPETPQTRRPKTLEPRPASPAGQNPKTLKPRPACPTGPNCSLPALPGFGRYCEYVPGPETPQTRRPKTLKPRPACPAGRNRAYIQAVPSTTSDSMETIWASRPIACPRVKIARNT